MAKISDVIKRLEHIKGKFGDKECKIVNYHSDFNDDKIIDIEEAIIYIVSDCENYVLIGGESR